LFIIASLLVSIIDCHPLYWAQLPKSLEKGSQITEIFDQLILFYNAFLALRYDNQLAVISSQISNW